MGKKSTICRGKSCSPPSAEEPGKDQQDKPEELPIKDAQCSGDQVLLKIVFGWLCEAFARVSSIECVREVCAQDKTLTPPTSNPAPRRKKKLTPVRLP